MIILPYLHEPAILHTLQQRYSESSIYTWTGPILLAVNPFKTLPIYTPSAVEAYATRGACAMPPHIFLVADVAYRGMLFDGVAQSIHIHSMC